MAEADEMLQLCRRVQTYVAERNYKKCKEEISYAMYLKPDAPEPHNLMGILLEKQMDHKGALRHFRAAYALDPTYGPARENLMEYTRFDRKRTYHYMAADCG